MCSVMIFIEHKHSDHSFLAACNFISISAHPTSRNKIHPAPTQPRSQLRSSIYMDTANIAVRKACCVGKWI